MQGASAVHTASVKGGAGALRRGVVTGRASQHQQSGKGAEEQKRWAWQLSAGGKSREEAGGTSAGAETEKEVMGCGQILRLVKTTRAATRWSCGGPAYRRRRAP